MTFPEMIHGAKPKVAPFEATDPIEELQKLLRGEVSSWDDITQISDLYHDYMMQQYESTIPGFSDILKEGGADTLSLLGEAAPLIRGELPEDVKAQVMRNSAFQSLGSGIMGSGMASSLTARDLGRTSLDLMNQGANLLQQGGNSAQRWQSIAQGTILPPTASMYSPQWFAEFMGKQRASKQATKQLQYNVDAAPDPVVSGITGTAFNLLGAYLGAGRGGGGNMLATNQGQSYGQFEANSAANAGMSQGDWQNSVSNSLYDPSFQTSTPFNAYDYKNPVGY